MLLPTRVPWPILSGEPWAPPTCLPATSLVLPGSSPFSTPRAPTQPHHPMGTALNGPRTRRARLPPNLLAPRTVTRATHACPVDSTWAHVNVAVAMAIQRSVSLKQVSAR